MTDDPPFPDAAPGPPPRRSTTWRRALAVGLVGFMVWLVFDAPTLQHNAEAQTVGTRRTVALYILGPIADISRGLQLSHVVSVADGIIGRTGNQPGNGTGPVTIGPSSNHRPATTTTTAAARPGTRPSSTTTTTVPILHPTPQDPLRVLIVGDSLGLDLGPPLQNDLADTNVVQATLDATESTGLTRPDYYNWPAELQKDLNSIDPQVVVIMMGANDPQDFPGPPDVAYGTPQWDQMYAQRVRQFMAEATSKGAKVIWVGMPPMQDPTLNQKMQNINSIDQAQAAQNPNVDWMPSWNLLGGPQGVFQPYLEENGQEVNVREPDGVHIAPGGGEILSQAVMAQMRTALHIDLPG